MESVPPRLYGGTEFGLVTANPVSCASMALRLDNNIRDPIPYYMLMLDRVRELAEEFAILHFHIDQFHFPLFRQIADRTVTTLHGRQDFPTSTRSLRFSEMPLVFISDQRRPIGSRADVMDEMKS